MDVRYLCNSLDTFCQAKVTALVKKKKKTGSARILDDFSTQMSQREYKIMIRPKAHKRIDFKEQKWKWSCPYTGEEAVYIQLKAFYIVTVLLIVTHLP